MVVVATDGMDANTETALAAQARRAKYVKLLSGTVIVIGIAVSRTGTAQLTKSTYRADFQAPFFVTWFSVIWLAVCYPLYLLVRLLNCRRKESFADIWR